MEAGDGERVPYSETEQEVKAAAKQSSLKEGTGE